MATRLHPSRLLVKQDCVTVTGIIVDATANQSHPQADGVRHEGDGDTHGWLKVDPQFASLINSGNTSDEGGNLVFELVCHYKVTQADAKPACVGFKDHTTIPPVGTHVAITGTLCRKKITRSGTRYTRYRALKCSKTRPCAAPVLLKVLQGVNRIETHARDCDRGQCKASQSCPQMWTSRFSACTTTGTKT